MSFLSSFVSVLYFTLVDINTYSTWLEIDLNALKNNVAEVIRMTGREVMAVIKANGYGHGMRPIAQACVAGGATWCGVARIEEALALRRAGISNRILVLGFTPASKIPDAIEHNITIALFNAELAQTYLEYVRIHGGTLRAHVKVETGMGRLGMPVEVVAPFLRALKNSPIQEEGIFTHFARADEPDSDSTPAQIRLFNSLLTDLEQQGLKPGVVHAANSAGILNFPSSYYDLTRPGDLIMGMSPIEGKPLPAQFKPVLTWKARLISLRTFPAGQGISYGSKYVTTKDERIGVIPIGYGDGFRRVDGQQVLVGGKRVNIVGRVCMDQCMLQLDSVPEVKIGDEVVLVGRQGAEFISIDEVAQRWGTINYEVVCGLAERLPRIYIE